MMDLTPHWQQTRQSNADAHAALQWVAAKIHEQTEQNVSLPQSDEIDLSTALELGLRASNDGKIGFSDPEVRCEYLVRHAVDLALVAWDESENFASVFDDIYRRNIRISADCQIGVLVLLVLKHEYNKDIAGRVAEIAKLDNAREKRDNSCRSLYNTFCELIPKLDLELESLIDTLEAIFPTSAGHKVYSIVQYLAACSQDNADFLYERFIAHPESPIVGLGFDALLGLSKLDLYEAHSRALILTDSEQLALRQIGIAVLGRFNYDISKHYNLLHDTLSKFKALKTSHNLEIDCVLVEAYGNLINKSDKGAEVLVEFASHPDPAIQHRVSYVLFLKADEFYNQPWFKKALLSLTRVASFSKEISHNLDYCTEHYVKNDPDTALQIIEIIALGWNDSRKQEEEALPNMLNTTFTELFNNQLNSLNAAITRWFASSDIQLHLAGSNVIHFFNSIPVGDDAVALAADDELHSAHSRGDRHKEATEVVRKKTFSNRVFTLSKKELDTLDEQTVVCVLYRLAGYITDAPSLAALLLSAIKRETYSPDITKLIVGLLSEYVLYNYPRDAGEYLKYRLEESYVTALYICQIILNFLKTKNHYFVLFVVYYFIPGLCNFSYIVEPEINVIQEALNRSDAYFEARQKLPRLNELKPSSRQTYLLRLAKLKQQNTMMEEAQRYSVLASILPTVKLKYGRAVSHEQDGAFTKPSKFASFSYDYELPQGEFIDPLGQAYQRFLWQKVGLHNTKHRTEDEINGETNI